MLCFFYLARTQAAGADFHPLCSAVDFCTDRNKVGPEHSASSIVSMTDVVSGHMFLTADITFSRHYKPPRNFSSIDN
jgi:hypothetical protein